MTVTPMES